ncbi:MAG: hypothetical protein ACLQVD_17560 [Capsulimonadaceae bacterium]
MRRNLRKTAEAEFENFGGASAPGGPRAVEGVDALLQMVNRRWQSRPGQRRAPAAADQGQRKQSSLDDGRDFRRRPPPNPKRRFPKFRTKLLAV